MCVSKSNFESHMMSNGKDSLNDVDMLDVTDLYVNERMTSNAAFPSDQVFTWSVTHYQWLHKLQDD